MAILKDSTVTGNLRVTGTIYGDVPLDDLTGADDLKAIEEISAVNGILRKTAANTWELVNTVTPSSHTHGNITNDGKIGTEANKAVYTGTGGAVTAGVLPVSAGGTGTTTLTEAREQLGGPEFIVGTWTGATGTWTGVTRDSELYDGKQILLYMPFGGSGNATLNLTLSGGGTTGAKNVYFESTGRFTTHKGQNAILHLVYKTGLKLSNGTTYEGWWYIANRDTNDTAYYSKEIYSNILAGANKIYSNTFLLQLLDGRWESPVLSSSTEATKNPNTNGFVLGQIMWYSGTIVDENNKPATYTLNYTHPLVDYRYSFNLANTDEARLVTNKPIFLKGTVTNGLFYLDTTRWVTQTLPTSDDGFVYIYLGNAYDWYRGSFSNHHPIYWYKNGSIKLFSDYASVAGSANSVAWNNVSGKPSSYTPSNHAHGNISNNGELATADMAVVTGANKQITTANLATNSPTAASTTSTTFIDTISQNSLGKITATKKTLPTASTTTAGIVKLGTGDNDAATGSHVHSYAASNSPGGSATSADGFSAAKTIALTGNVTGSAAGGNGNNGWSIATTIGQGVVTNGMLANSKMTIAGNEISLGGSLTAAALKSDLGLKALAYKDSLTASDVGALPITGGTLTGALTLNGAPTANLHAATKQYVDGIVAANDAMVFKGTLNGGSTTTYTPAANCGDTYKVATAGLINGERVEVGDILICMADGVVQATSSNVSTVKTSWAIVQNNVDGAVFKSTNTFTNGQILVADGTNGKIKTSGYTIAKSVPSDAVFTDTTYSAEKGITLSSGKFGHSNTAITAQTTQAVYPIKIDAYGHITGYGSAQTILSLGTTSTTAAAGNHTHTTTLAAGGTSTVNLSANTAYTLSTGGTSVVFKTPADNDTKNTAGSTNSDSKLFLVGATSQAANPQTYSDSEVYTTNGTLTTKILSTSAGINANTANSGTAGGVSLYATDPNSYGIAMRNTGTSSGQLGKHGYVQGDWATYFNMHASAGANGRGWIFRYRQSENVASINGEGSVVFNGSVTVGGNAANTSGARMVYNSTEKTLDFVFA